jgi:hypothetical protein
MSENGRKPGSPCDDALAALYGADEAVLARQREMILCKFPS